MAEYEKTLRGRALRPREYLEYQLNMTDEEKEAKQRWIEDLFSRPADNALLVNGAK